MTPGGLAGPSTRAEEEMPTYHYRCKECAHEFEMWQGISDPPCEQCNECGGKVERVISGGAGLLFKGSGFYITDYRSSGYKKDAKKDAPATDSKKSESKPGKKDSGATGGS